VGVLLVSIAIGAFILWRRRNQHRAAGVGQINLPKIGPDQNLETYFSLSGVPRREWNISSQSYKSELSRGSPEFQIAVQLLNLLDGKSLVDAVVSVHGVVNPQIAANFFGFREVLQRRLRQDPHLFRKEDWMTLDRSDLRRWVVHSYGILAQKQTWNSIEEAVPIIPVLHGTDVGIAWKILETGFSALSSLDAGFYGRGIYFSSSAKYTLPYYCIKRNPCVLLCLAIPGNVFPVVEDRREPNSLLGMPIKSGYQSNYVLTTKDGNPCQARMPLDSCYDELVLDQEAQVVPIAIVEFDPVKLAPFARDFQREIPVT